MGYMSQFRARACRPHAQRRVAASGLAREAALSPRCVRCHRPGTYDVLRHVGAPALEIVLAGARPSAAATQACVAPAGARHPSVDRERPSGVSAAFCLQGTAAACRRPPTPTADPGRGTRSI